MSLEQVAVIAQGLRARRAAPPADLATRRAGFEAQMAAFPPPDEARCTAAELPGEWIDMPGGDPSRVILWLHGGAFVLGSAASYRRFGALLAQAARCRVLLLDYRLAPEHRFPAALEDAIAAAAWLGDLDLSAWAIGGDSAGANLAVAATQALLAAGAPAPAACCLLSPYLDLTHRGGSIRSLAERDPFIDPADMPATAAVYHGDADPADPRVSPLFGPVDDFPPTLIQIGSEEVLRDDATRFADALRAAEREVLLQSWAGMIHVWPVLVPPIAEGGWAIAQMGNFLRMKLL